jgi:microcystin-dependent protein
MSGIAVNNFSSLEAVMHRRRALSLAYPQLVGDMKLSGRVEDHERWLLCDGRSVRRWKFPELFAAIGYSYGGSGNSFNLPNAAGRVLAAVSGADVSGGRALGEATGSETHTLTIEELATHTHDISNSATGVTTVSDGAHVHTGTTDVSGAHSHTVANTVVVNGQNTRIDVDESPGELNLDASQTTTTSTAGAHAHTFTTASAGAHTHAITDPTHTHAAAQVGGAVPFNIMQPTLFVGNAFIFCGRRVGAVLLR